MNRIIRAVVMTTAALSLAACGTEAGGNATPSEPPFDPPAEGELIGQGTVLQKENLPAKLCLGMIQESYPPSCSGPEIVGWDWASVEQSETASGVTWGSYAVQGTWDGTEFTLTQNPIPLSLYDPPADQPDPRLDGSNPGAGSEDELLAIQTEILDPTNGEVLISSITNGYVLLVVFHDDGTLQEYFDRQYGADMIAVQSALRPVG
ncbi:hypothetical protein [Arthrobacter sp. H5]|uniref:hypothetical protein n=1 Tax=Arthrobacter sp. H5 TaxID=1267973 RepID=UPI0012DF2037|nr:hypothetical protein [Arthrobacter sp. H5]